MAAAAAILLAYAGASAVAAVLPEGWVSVQADSVESLLANRDFDAAVDLASVLVDSLVVNDTQGADLARDLELQARTLRRHGQWRDPQTLEIAQRAVAACAGPPAADPELAAACLNTLGLIHFQRSEYEGALGCLEQATELWRTARGPDDQKVAAGLNNQGLVLEATGANEEARVVLEEAARIYTLRQAEPAYFSKLAQTTMALAKLHLKLGEYDPALERAERAVTMHRASGDAELPRLGSALGDLAAMYRTLGELDRAEATYEEALVIATAGYGPQHGEVGRLLNNLGNLRADRGDIAAARTCFEQALAITEKTAGADDPQTGVRLLNLASILAQLGDLEMATSHLLRAEDIFLTRLGADHLYMGFAKQELGSALAANGEPEAGLTRLQTAQRILEAELGPEHPAVAEVLADAAEVLGELGHLPEAAANVARALTITRAALGLAHPEVAHLLTVQGRLARQSGDAAGAVIMLSEAVAVGAAALGPEHPDLAVTHLELSRALAGAGRSKTAFAEAATAERIGREHFALAAAAFEERRALQFAGRRTSGLGLAATLACELQTTEAVTRLWDEVIRSRGLVLDLMGDRQQSQRDSRPALNSAPTLADSLAHATRELAHLFVRGVGEDEPADYRAALTAARDRRETLERRFAAASLPYARRLASGRAGFAAVARALPVKDTLVSYLRHTSDPDSAAQFAALVRRPDGVAPQLINLGPARRIEGAVAAWRWSYLTGTTADTSGLIALAAECSVAGRRLAALIWDPLALDNATGTIYLVPDGALDLVDFLALPRAAGGFVVENEAVLTLVSAERDLVGGEARAQGPAGLLVMGGMDFGPAAHQPAAAGDCRNYQDLSFSPLPGTLREATAVADLWTALGGGPVQRLVGPAAREGSFKSQAGASRVAHLATHGFFLGGDCRAATPGTRGVGTLQPDPARKLSADPVNPLLLAGLAFSGANREERQDGEDGILTAYEVASLDLSGVELAVLSACDTGQGRVLAGEGVFGLQRAFALAGVRGVIMSLWPVDDELATAWMEQLYRHHLRDGMAYPLAVREASRAMLLARRARGLPEHPCRWSPFIGIRTGS